jgi:hypothetical protein
MGAIQAPRAKPLPLNRRLRPDHALWLPAKSAGKPEVRLPISGQVLQTLARRAMRIGSREALPPAFGAVISTRSQEMRLGAAENSGLFGR